MSKPRFSSILSTLQACYQLYKFKFVDKKRSIDDAVDFAFTHLKTFLQIRDEIRDFLKILEKERPLVILEIGTAQGGSAFLFLQAAPDDACLISIDLPGGQFRRRLCALENIIIQVICAA